MAPAKFLQTHNVESLGKHIQNKEERRNKRELERRKYEKGQETRSQPPMVTPGPQAILKTETTVLTEARTVDLFCNLTCPLSATDMGVGNAARKDLQLTRPGACKGSKPALCSLTMANLAANTGDSLTSKLASPPIPDEALVDPVPGPLLPNGQNSQLSSKHKTLKGLDGHETCSSVFDSASRSIEGLNHGIAVESHGGTVIHGSNQSIRDCTDRPGVPAGSAAQNLGGEERVIGVLDFFEIDKTCSSSSGVAPKPLLPPINSVVDNAIGGQHQLRKSVEEDVGSRNLRSDVKCRPAILSTKLLRPLPSRRSASRRCETPRVLSPAQPMCVPGTTTYPRGTPNSSSHAMSATGNNNSHQDQTETQLSIATPSSSCSSTRTSVSVDTTPAPRYRRSRRQFTSHNIPSTRRPTYPRTSSRVSKNTRKTRRIPTKALSSHPVVRAIQSYETCHACGFSPDHLLQLSNAVETLIKSTAKLSDGVKGMVMLQLFLSSVRDYAMNLSSRETGYGNLNTTIERDDRGIVAVQPSVWVEASSDDESMDDAEDDVDNQSDDTSSEAANLHTVDKDQGGKRRRWSNLEERRLRAWMQEGMDWVWISKSLGRSEAAVSQHWKIMTQKIR